MNENLIFPVLLYANKESDEIVFNMKVGVQRWVGVAVVGMQTGGECLIVKDMLDKI